MQLNQVLQTKLKKAEEAAKKAGVTAKLKQIKKLFQKHTLLNNFIKE